MIRPELLRPSPYADYASRQSPVKIRPAAERLAAARLSQEASKTVIRIYRPVLNELDFEPQFFAWREYMQGATASRRSLGNLTMTLFDSNQQPLKNVPTYTEAEMKDFLGIRYPKLFEPTPRIAVTGTSLLGSEKYPFVALGLATDGFLKKDKKEVLKLIAPELTIANDHQKEHRLHVSLGQAQPETAKLILRKFQEEQIILPRHVQFGPGEVTVERSLL